MLCKNMFFLTISILVTDIVFSQSKQIANKSYLLNFSIEGGIDDYFFLTIEKSKQLTFLDFHKKNETIHVYNYDNNVDLIILGKPGDPLPKNVHYNPVEKRAYYNYKVDSIISADIAHIRCDKIAACGDTLQLWCQKDTMRELSLFSLGAGKTYLKTFMAADCQIDTLAIDDVEIEGSKEREPFISNKFDWIKLKKTWISGTLSLGNLLPRYIKLEELHFKDGISILDLTKQRPTSGHNLCELDLANMTDGINQIKMNYEWFQLKYDSSISIGERARIYRQLLDQQQKDGFTNGYEKADKEYRRFKYRKNGLLGAIQDDIDNWWWNYGYDKSRVVTNSIKVFMVFLFLNFIIYSGLIKVYYPEKFKQYDKGIEWIVENKLSSKLRIYIFKKMPFIAVYTAYIFWGVRLELKELELRKPLFFLILVGEYVVGLVCIAYIANYIITK